METLERQDSLQWKKAIDFEFQSLQDNKTWLLFFFPLSSKN
jgi:hypothetical protein